jgi:serine/threonine protein phosphatase 1
MIQTIVHNPYPTTAFTDGSVVYAIGDVHGSLENLTALLNSIEPLYTADLDAGNVVYLIFLGDYVDRGKNNIGSIDLIMDRNSRDKRLIQIDLVGNHDMMLALSLSYNNRSHIENWMNNGGTAVINELVPPVEFEGLAPNRFELAKERMGERRLGWFQNLQSHFRIGNTFFVHAGIHPMIREESLGLYFGVPWWEDPDYAWVRGNFLDYERFANDPTPSVLDTHCVVHGHTPGQPTLLPHRIGVDTGCYYSGIMTAVRVCDGIARFIQCYEDESQFLQWLGIKYIY